MNEITLKQILQAIDEIVYYSLNHNKDPEVDKAIRIILGLEYDE